MYDGTMVEEARRTDEVSGSSLKDRSLSVTFL